MSKVKKSASGKGTGIIFFLVGFVGALVVGWIVFPNLLYSKKTQPVNFLHSAHQDSACEDCHTYNDDGSYAGIPNIDTCVECHEEMQGDTKDEKVLVEDYIQKNKSIPWLVYAWQPDNVYFSHPAHTVKQDIKCVRCHRDVMKDKKLPVYYQDRLTGYSKSTMKMVECEKCHAKHGASNACHQCHK